MPSIEDAAFAAVDPRVVELVGELDREMELSEAGRVFLLRVLRTAYVQGYCDLAEELGVDRDSTSLYDEFREWTKTYRQEDHESASDQG